MKFNLPPVDKMVKFSQDTELRIYIGEYSNRYRDKNFFCVHSGWKTKNPTLQYWSAPSIRDMYDKLDIHMDNKGEFVVVKVPAGVKFKITKLGLGKTFQQKYVQLAILQSYNKKNPAWRLPSFSPAIIPEQFAELEIEEV